MSDLEKVVKDACQGDSAAFRSLYFRFQPTVKRKSQEILQNSDEGKEVSQEIWLKVATKLPSLKSPHAFSAWLDRIIRSVSLNHIRQKERKRKALSEHQNSQIPSVETTESEVMRKLDWEALQNLLAKQDSINQEVFHLRMEGQLTYTQIAEKLELSEYRVIQIVKQLTKTIRKEFAGYMSVLSRAA